MPSRSTDSGLICTVGFESPTACGWIDFWGASKKFKVMVHPVGLGFFFDMHLPVLGIGSSP